MFEDGMFILEAPPPAAAAAAYNMCLPPVSSTNGAVYLLV